MVEGKQEMIALLTGVKSSKRNYYTELKSTVEQLRKKNMQLEIINDVMKSIKVDMSLNDVLKNVIDKLTLFMKCDRICLLVLKNEELVLSNVYPEKSHCSKVYSTVFVENSLYWSSLKNKETIHLQFEQTDDEFFEKQFLLEAKINSILVLPIFIKNKGIGILSIGRKDGACWSDEDVSFLENLADHLAVSIENTQLYTEVVRSKQHWEDTFKAVDDMIVIFDKNLHILQSNDAAKNVFNCEPEEVDERLKTLLQTTLQSLKPEYSDLYFDNQSIFEAYTYPIQNNQNQVYGVILYAKDVTGKRKLEAQLLHSGKLAAIGEMAAGIAHELNSPLTAILGNSQILLRNSQEEDPAYSLLTDIKNCGDRSKKIIKSLLTFSRQDEYLFELFSLNEAVNQVLHLLKYQLQKSEVDVNLELSDRLPKLLGSQQQIEQIIVNLILNARDALEISDHINKEIVIKTLLVGNKIVLTVQDNGIGIHENMLSDIFLPFYTTKEMEKGTGLGLSVSFGIAKAHGGTIEVKSKLNQGSTFTLKLPLQPPRVIEVSS